MNANLERTPATTDAMFALMRSAGVVTAAPNVVNHTAKRRLIARAFKAANAVLAVLGTPDNVHRFLATLIGLSRGQIKFEASDADIGREAFADKRTKNTLKMWSKRSRKAIEKWQLETGWRIVTISPGGKVGNEYSTTAYELPLLEVIAKVARSRDMRSAAFDCIIELQDESRKVKRERFDNRPRTHGEAMMKRCQKAALTYAEKMCVEALNMHPIGTQRAQALADVGKLADAFARELNAVMREFAQTGRTRKQRAESVRSKKPNVANAKDE
jgi:hypothetical protein